MRACPHRRARTPAQPDVLLLQELHPLFLDAVAEALPHHLPVSDGKFEVRRRTLGGVPVVEHGLAARSQGWTHEGTVVFDSRRFELVKLVRARQRSQRALSVAELPPARNAQGAEDIGMKEQFRRLFWARHASEHRRAHSLMPAMRVRADSA